MPICFSLTRKGEDRPASLAQVDNEICAHFNVTPDPIKYYERWYDIIDLSLAFGDTHEQIRAKFDGTYANDARLREITDYIFEHFTPNNWRAV